MVLADSDSNETIRQGHSDAQAEESSSLAEPSGADEDTVRDPDDFRFWSEDQAERISKAIREAFAVELNPEVIIADANLSALANRILVSRNLLSSG